MRKYLLVSVVFIALITGCMWWLGQLAVKSEPPEGEVRIPVEGILP